MKRFFSYFLFALAVITLSSQANGQNKVGNVSGTIYATDGSPLQGATIALLKAKDSSLTKVALSGKNGVFEMEKLPDGKFLIKISAVGFATYFSKAFTLGETNPSFNLQTVSMAVAEKTLVM